MNGKVIFFVPVEEKYLTRWEYYQVDYEALTAMYSNVMVCTSIWQVLNNWRGTRLVYCWWWHQSAPIILLARLLGIKTQVTGAIHMFDLSGATDFFSKPFFYKVASRLALALADRNLFISRDQYLQITSHLKVNNPTVVLSSLAKNSSFSRELIAEERKKRRQNEEWGRTALFLTVSWHTQEQYRRKGIFETLGALALVKERTDFQFRWLIAGGEGDGLPLLRSRIAELGLEDNVDVRMDISQEEKRELFLTFDLYIQPSWCEGFGNAVLEATSHGLPALVSRYTAQPEVVGDSGYVTMEMSAEGIYRELQAFLALDSHSRAQLEKEVLKHVERHFTFERRLESLEKISREMGLAPRTVQNNSAQVSHR